MRGIGGNTIAELQIKTDTKNAIGENAHSWKTVQRLKGWFDLLSGDARRTAYNAKIEESTHVFVADYVPLQGFITAESARLVHCGQNIRYNPYRQSYGAKKRLTVGNLLEVYGRSKQWLNQQ